MFELLGDEPIDIALFLAQEPPFAGTIVRTTWEDLLRSGYVANVLDNVYRLTARGWLYCLELADAAKSPAFMERFGRILAALKRRVKGRVEPAILSPRELAEEVHEPFGWIFNVIDSKAASDLNSGRIGATWYQNEEAVSWKFRWTSIWNSLISRPALAFSTFNGLKNSSNVFVKAKKTALSFTVLTATRK